MFKLEQGGGGGGVQGSEVGNLLFVAHGNPWVPL